MYKLVLNNDDRTQTFPYQRYCELCKLYTMYYMMNINQQTFQKHHIWSNTQMKCSCPKTNSWVHQIQIKMLTALFCYELVNRLCAAWNESSRLFCKSDWVLFSRVPDNSSLWDAASIWEFVCRLKYFLQIWRKNILDNQMN